MYLERLLQQIVIFLNENKLNKTYELIYIKQHTETKAFYVQVYKNINA